MVARKLDSKRAYMVARGFIFLTTASFLIFGVYYTVARSKEIVDEMEECKRYNQDRERQLLSACEVSREVGKSSWVSFTIELSDEINQYYRNLDSAYILCKENIHIYLKTCNNKVFSFDGFIEETYGTTKNAKIFFVSGLILPILFFSGRFAVNYLAPEKENNG